MTSAPDKTTPAQRGIGEWSVTWASPTAHHQTNKTMINRVADASWALRDNLAATYEDYARAAIEAMREPTPAMVKAGWEMGGSPRADIWRAMIDAALAEGETQ